MERGYSAEQCRLFSLVTVINSHLCSAAEPLKGIIVNTGVAAAKSLVKMKFSFSYLYSGAQKLQSRFSLRIIHICILTEG